MMEKRREIKEIHYLFEESQVKKMRRESSESEMEETHI